MEQLMTFFIVVNHTTFYQGNWGKAISLKDAMKNCKVNLKSKFVIYQCILKDDSTMEQVERVRQCFIVNNSGGVQLCDNPTPKDLDLINSQVIGWIINEDFVK